MPTKKAAYKAVRSDVKKRERNQRISAELKTVTRNLEKLIDEKKAGEARAYLKTVSAKYRKTAGKGIIKKKTASRKISRMEKRINKLGSA